MHLIMYPSTILPAGRGEIQEWAAKAHNETAKVLQREGPYFDVVWIRDGEIEVGNYLAHPIEGKVAYFHLDREEHRLAGWDFTRGEIVFEALVAPDVCIKVIEYGSDCHSAYYVITI